MSRAEEDLLLSRYSCPALLLAFLICLPFDFATLKTPVTLDSLHILDTLNTLHTLNPLKTLIQYPEYPK